MTQEEVLANCYTDATTSTGTEGLQRKLQEMRYAIALEQKYSKNEILLGYLNIANFGGQTYGIDAAARHYFNVAAKDLSVGQAAALAGMVQNPNSYRIDYDGGSTTDSNGEPVNSEADGYKLTKDRQVYVLDRLLADGKITQEQHDTAVAEPITPTITQPKTGCASAPSAQYFCQYVKNIIKTDPAFGATPEDRIEGPAAGRAQDLHDAGLPPAERRAGHHVPDRAAPRSPACNFGASAVNVEVGDRPRALDGAEHAVQRGQGQDRRRSVVQDPRLRGRSEVRQVDRLLGRLDVQALHAHRLAREGPLRERSAQRQRPRHQAGDQLVRRRLGQLREREGQQLQRRRAASSARRCSSPPPRSTRATSRWPRSSTSATSRRSRPRWASRRATGDARRDARPVLGRRLQQRHAARHGRRLRDGRQRTASTASPRRSTGSPTPTASTCRSRRRPAPRCSTRRSPPPRRSCCRAS